MLYQVIYSSKAARPMASQDLEQILVDARAGNEARDVTGALVYSDGVFLQILEGERGEVDDLIRSIREDTRHDSFKVFYRAEVPARAFSSWRMAYLSPDAEEMSRWAGLEGTETLAELLANVHGDSQRVPRILVSIVEALAAKSKRE